MNDTEDAARHLLAAATEDIPPGIDLLSGVRARSKARVVRVRALMAAGVAVIVAAGAAITLSAVQAPSAFAQVTRAASRTAAQSYHVSSTSTLVTVPGLIPPSPVTITGEFDPVHGIGEETSSKGFQVRYVGGFIYLPLTDSDRAVFDKTPLGPMPVGDSWVRLPMPLQLGANATAIELLQLGTIATGLAPVDPQGLLAVLKSASQVREVGPASGPGWTGSAYTFAATITLPGSPPLILRTSGTVDVDQQGRVRQLDATQSIGPMKRTVEMTFGDFGIPVSVSAPPTSQTFTPPLNVSIGINGN